MRLVVVSHKPCWPSAGSPTGFGTDGGFPFQMAALSELFDATTLVLPRRASPPPAGLRPLDGHRLSVRPLAEPPGRGIGRKLALAGWLPWQLPRLWRELGRADAVHAAVPGDVGALAVPLALARRKPLFVRHCGTWGRPATAADSLLHATLVRIAGGRNVVLATGGGGAPPEDGRPIDWIFATSLTATQLATLPRAETWQPGRPPRLVSVGRLTRGKNAAATVRALAEVRRRYPGATLDLVGDGTELAPLRSLAGELRLAEAVTFHGNLEHSRVLARLASSHVFVFPTRVAEGFPKAVLEAMACGLPVVAPRVSVLSQLLADGRGVLLDDTTPEAVAAAVLGLLDEPGVLAATAEAARLHARGFSLERWRDEIGARLEAAWGRSLKDGGSD
jgi:glycosyltransferase involved in cell wall biosynthesis